MLQRYSSVLMTSKVKFLRYYVKSSIPTNSVWYWYWTFDKIYNLITIYNKSKPTNFCAQILYNFLYGWTWSSVNPKSPLSYRLQLRSHMSFFPRNTMQRSTGSYKWCNILWYLDVWKTMSNAMFQEVWHTCSWIRFHWYFYLFRKRRCIQAIKHCS